MNSIRRIEIFLRRHWDVVEPILRWPNLPLYNFVQILSHVGVYYSTIFLIWKFFHRAVYCATKLLKSVMFSMENLCFEKIALWQTFFLTQRSRMRSCWFMPLYITFARRWGWKLICELNEFWSLEAEKIGKPHWSSVAAATKIYRSIQFHHSHLVYANISCPE